MDRCRKRAGEYQGSPGGEIASRDELRILCRRCDHHVTDADAALEVSGQHAHTFENPAGYVFPIRCFRVAPGVRAFGAPTTEHTWFPGHAWQIATCTGCDHHLGWHFTGNTTFTALITPRIREA